MSELDTLALELRTMANKLRCVLLNNGVCYMETLDTLYLSMGDMREAADTIESLRDRLQEIQGVTGESRYSELFGSPERAARTLRNIPCCGNKPCVDCPIYEPCCGKFSEGHHNPLLVWLMGDAE